VCKYIYIYIYYGTFTNDVMIGKCIVHWPGRQERHAFY